MNVFWVYMPFNFQEWLASNFSNGNDHQLKKLLIVRQILLVSILVNVQRAVWRIWTLMLECKGLISLKFIFLRRTESISSNCQFSFTLQTLATLQMFNPKSTLLYTWHNTGNWTHWTCSLWKLIQTDLPVHLSFPVLSP